MAIKILVDSMRVFIVFLAFWVGVRGEVLDFDLIRMPSGNPNAPHALIISGIQGDEPGGFNASNLFLQHYKILEGEVWVIPNLNKHSILKNHRGIYGDMNRKFASLSRSDKEYEVIERVKGIIIDPSIQVVYHLHDGSGFYRDSYINQLQNPKRWGNCSIIDQERLEGAYYENLSALSSKITQNINSKILKDFHRYHTRNTQTRLSDKDMEKSLTFFAIKNKKTALANEASKNLPINERVYYHLLGIEGMLEAVGIRFERDFELSPVSISSLLYPLDSYIRIDELIQIPLFNLRPRIAFFPLPKSKEVSKIPIRSNQYIVGLSQRGRQVLIKYGNRVATTLEPLWIEFADTLPKVQMVVDGRKYEAEMGEMVGFEDFFKVALGEEFRGRVNVIGFRGEGENEANAIIRLGDLEQGFSLDRAGKKYRIEFYDEGGRFLGMIVMDYKG